MHMVVGLYLENFYIIFGQSSIVKLNYCFLEFVSAMNLTVVDVLFQFISRVHGRTEGGFGVKSPPSPLIFVERSQLTRFEIVQIFEIVQKKIQ